MGKMRPLIDSIGCVRAEFFAELSSCAAICCGGQTCCAGEGLFGCGERLWPGPMCKRRSPEHCHPVIQTAPRTVNERSGELCEFEAVG